VGCDGNSYGSLEKEWNARLNLKNWQTNNWKCSHQALLQQAY
jgi:hypothetical protein